MAKTSIPPIFSVRNKEDNYLFEEEIHEILLSKLGATH